MTKILYGNVDSVECFECECTKCGNHFTLSCSLVRHHIEFCPLCGEQVKEVCDIDD